MVVLFMSTRESSDAHTMAEYQSKARPLERNLEDTADYKGMMFLILE